MFRAFEWSQRKNIWRLANRNICFEQIVSAIETGKLLDIVRTSETREVREPKNHDF